MAAYRLVDDLHSSLICSTTSTDEANKEATIPQMEAPDEGNEKTMAALAEISQTMNTLYVVYAEP